MTKRAEGPKKGSAAGAVGGDSGGRAATWLTVRWYEASTASVAGIAEQAPRRFLHVTDQEV